MYLTYVKTVLREGIYQTFDSEYVESDFRDIFISLEFPVKKADYPGIWVDFSPRGNLQVAGVHHGEYADPDASGNSRLFTRWFFEGEASFTVVGLTSLERDRLYDEVVRVLAFGQEAPSTSEFRTYVEDNEFIGMNLNFDQIGQRGHTQSVGTPWGTNDVIYEGEVSMTMRGEFIADSQTNTLVPLSEIVAYPYADNESDPKPPDGNGTWV